MAYDSRLVTVDDVILCVNIIGIGIECKDGVAICYGPFYA